jgi:hypothetical protein
MRSSPFPEGMILGSFRAGDKTGFFPVLSRFLSLSLLGLGLSW